MTIQDYQIVNSYARPYSRQQATVGGILSGAARRFKARGRHALVRSLHQDGFSQTAIAREVGYSQPTVSRVLRGLIRTCLTAAETVAKAVAYPLSSEAIRELTPTPKVLSTRPAKPSRKASPKRKKRWNWFKGKWGDHYRRKFAAKSLDRPTPVPDGTCECGFFGYFLGGDPCAMCGRDYPAWDAPQGPPIPFSLENMTVADWEVEWIGRDKSGELVTLYRLGDSGWGKFVENWEDMGEPNITIWRKQDGT